MKSSNCLDNRSYCGNILTALHQQECNGRPFERKICRLLLESRQQKHDLCWTNQRSNCRVEYDGNLYLSNYKEWFQGCFHNGIPHILKTNLVHEPNSTSSRLVKGVIRYQTPCTKLNDTKGLLSNNYDESVFVLLNSYMHQYRLCRDQWIFSRKVFLSKRYSFEYIEYDQDCERFVLKSKRFPVVHDKDVLYYFAVFDLVPLVFVGLFAVRESIFGKIREAYATNGLLVLLVNDMYFFYDLHSIIQKYLMQHCNLEEVLKVFDSETDEKVEIGSIPYGLPENIIISNTPDFIYQISIKRWKSINGFSFGGEPWTCLVNRESSVEFTIQRLHDQKIIALQEDNDKNDDGCIDEKHVFYHSDGSGRILCVSNDHVRFLKLYSKENDLFEISTLFSISFITEESLVNERRYSRYGRSLHTSHHPGTRNLQSHIIHSIDYDEVLDVIGVLFTKDLVGATNSYVIGIYDNQNGRLLREVFIDEPVSEEDENIWSLYLSQLVVICVLKSIVSRGRAQCFIYQLASTQCICRPQLPTEA